MTKRPIDRKRDAGGTIEIGTPDDQSAVTAIFPIGDDLYVVKERGIYEVKLADRIDPNRTNIAIPNTHQRVLNYGSDASVVGRTLRKRRRTTMVRRVQKAHIKALPRE